MRALITFVDYELHHDDGYVQLLKELALHWRSRDSFSDPLRHALANPTPGRVDIWLDFGERRACFVVIYSIPAPVLRIPPVGCRQFWGYSSKPVLGFPPVGCRQFFWGA